MQSIKEKFNLFQRPRRSVELPTETTSLKSISEINSSLNVETTKSSSASSTTQSSSSSASSLSDSSSSEGDLSNVELKIHEETLSEASSFESTVTVLEKSRDLKEDLKLSVQNFDSFLSSNSLNRGATFADTNKKPLHESLLSLSRNELLLSASPNVKTHARTESIGCKLTATTGSPSKQAQQQQSGSLTGTNICRRSSDSDLSITPKGECQNCT